MMVEPESTVAGGTWLVFCATFPPTLTESSWTMRPIIYRPWTLKTGTAVRDPSKRSVSTPPNRMEPSSVSMLFG